ncbi:MAG: amidohydrolase, partial [bacterium]|nr:amidohydrolase [bacterium]
MEEILEAELPICDPHHHLWDHPEHRYLLDELLADTGSGHNVVSTVFMECASMYRASGPEAMRPVGETEFVNGIAAMSASGQYGETRACLGIVGFADLGLGPAVAEVLDAHLAASPRFRGIRHACGWDASDAVRVSHTNPPRHLLADAKFRAGFAELRPRGMSFGAWRYHPQIAELAALARAFPATQIIFVLFGGPLGIGPYAGRRDE